MFSFRSFINKCMFLYYYHYNIVRYFLGVLLNTIPGTKYKNTIMFRYKENSKRMTWEIKKNRSIFLFTRKYIWDIRRIVYEISNNRLRISRSQFPFIRWPQSERSVKECINFYIRSELFNGRARWRAYNNMYKTTIVDHFTICRQLQPLARSIRERWFEPSSTL